MKTQLINAYKEIISEYTWIVPDDFNIETRQVPYVVSRQLLHYFLKQEHSYLTWKEIASYTDQDHATVIHSIKKIKEYYDTDDNVLRKTRGFKSILDNMAIHIKAETVKYSDEKDLEAIEESITIHEKKAMENRLIILNEKGLERSYSISEFGTIFLSVKRINEREKDLITVSLINNHISILSEETSFSIMPYFYDFFTKIAEGYGKLDNEILIAILENLGIEPVNVNEPELVNSNNYPIFIKNK